MLPYLTKGACKIGPKLLLMTNRKAHMRFRLVPIKIDDLG